ncbi:MAG: tRNA1(Val) (adenine(37)-N6)-methyltransferase [Pseudomonadota bacterium]|uniref:tRNA1(Val) (adenine(37)-N6)-methyltransferase n=1 Tax=Roseovarius TaxID=74030 RepID=UPI0022A82092|nr:methyltransferase [Roseovarius sp. EGI FJ00037]MCZ0813887.1 methyltransferase [Roseovarius sp. EGI FJ00037]
MAEGWPEDRLSTDAFLGGKLRILQPRDGYRAGIDPVLLAASIPARAGDRVLDLGCGAGVAALCLARRIEGVRLTGLELQPDYADLARRNASANRIEMQVETGDLTDMPAALREQQFDHVISNPPYFDRRASTAARDTGREIALGEGTPLADWVKAAAKRTAPKGHATFIQRTARLPDLLMAMARHFGSLEVLPLIPRPGRAARLVLVRGRKGGRADFRLHDGWVLHNGASHDGDRENYNTATACILRSGAALPFPV